MIISASRRTDLPAFYTPWLLNRIKAGYCNWTNPFNPKQRKQINLTMEAVDAFVFWSKNPAPLLPHLPMLDRMGYRYYFQFTLNHYPLSIEPKLPELSARLATFHQLSGQIGAQRVVWRYDPIIISNATPFSYHLETFSQLASALEGATERVVISFLDLYPKLKTRLIELKKAWGLEIIDPLTASDKYEFVEFCHNLAQLARKNGMEIFTCSEDLDPELVGIEHGACIDGKLLESMGVRVGLSKDKAQRKNCLCKTSIDIGSYNTCPHNCTYCYANGKEETTRKNFSKHEPNSPFLIEPAPGNLR